MNIKKKKSFSILFKLSHNTNKIKKFSNIVNEAIKYAKQEHKIDVTIGCIGAAGPISRKRGYIKLTNSDLEINKKKILKETTLKKVYLINNFEAIGYGIDLLDLNLDLVKLPHIEDDLTSCMTKNNTISVIGSNVGLGMVIAKYNKKLRLHEPVPSEGGHMQISPSNELEFNLIKYLIKKVIQKKDVQPDFERIISNKGIELIFDYLLTLKKYKKTLIVRKIIKMYHQDKIIEISKNYNKSNVCKKTIDIYMNFYARICSNLALISECYSGLYITELVPLKNIMNVEVKKKILMNFMKKFEKHDGKIEILKKIPVYIVTNKDVALFGCGNVVKNFSGIL
ncbi:hypothetical protein HN415_06805 [Candidatus Woesearchaeota archaeon]|nr:hypothetical protein [Candidatus Woesearchaeota archaeon]